MLPKNFLLGKRTRQPTHEACRHGNLEGQPVVGVVVPHALFAQSYEPAGQVHGPLYMVGVY